MTGRVLGWNLVKRCGFIRPDEASTRDFFVHVTDLAAATELRRGQSVSFTPTDAPRRPHAADVRVLDPVSVSSQPEEGR